MDPIALARQAGIAVFMSMHYLCFFDSDSQAVLVRFSPAWQHSYMCAVCGNCSWQFNASLFLTSFGVNVEKPNARVSSGRAPVFCDWGRLNNCIRLHTHKHFTDKT